MGDSEQRWELVSAPSQSHPAPAGTTPRDIAAVLFRRRRIILTLLVSTLVGAAAATVWLRPYLSPARYSAGLKLILRKDRVDAVVTPADRAVPGLTTAVSAQELLSEIELLKSADVLERLALESQAPVERLRRDLVVEPVVSGRNLTNLIAVRYTASKPEEVTQVLRRLPEVYLEKYLRMNSRPAALEYFRSRANASGQQLRQAHEQLAGFQQRQPALAVDGAQQQARQKLLDLEKQRTATEAALREAETRAAELTRQLNALPQTVTTTRQMEETPYLARLKTQLSELEDRRARATFFREIEQLDRRVGEMRREIEAASPPDGGRVEESRPNPLRQPIESESLRDQAAASGLRARLGSLASQERAARDQLAAARQAAFQDAVELAELTRAVKTAEDDALLYAKKYAEAREADLLDQRRVLNVAVAEEARVPVQVESRSWWFLLAVGVLLGASLSTAAGFAAEGLDHSIHTPRQLEACAGARVLACIPQCRQG